VCSYSKGVYWYKSRGTWTARCKGKSLGQHATEEAAAQAYNIEAQRIGRVDLNDTDDPAALALISLAGRCRMTVSKPVLKVPMVSAPETTMS
jgi:hypothetical protein